MVTSVSVVSFCTEINLKPINLSILKLVTLSKVDKYTYVIEYWVSTIQFCSFIHVYLLAQYQLINTFLQLEILLAFAQLMQNSYMNGIYIIYIYIYIYIYTYVGSHAWMYMCVCGT